MNPTMDVGDVIRSLRRAKRMSQAQVAKAAGISTNLVSRVERGATNYRRATLDEIARALNTDVATLTSGAGPVRLRGDDPATRRLLSMWHGLPSDGRVAALEAVANVVALCATLEQLQARLQELELEVHRYELVLEQHAVEKRGRESGASGSGGRGSDRGGKRPRAV